MAAERVSIIGDGQMALTLADALVVRGVPVCIWGPFPADIEKVSKTRRSARLPAFALDPGVELTADDKAAFRDSTLIISAIPTQFLRSVWSRLQEVVPARVPIVSVTKGIEIETRKRPTEIIGELAGDRPLCAL